MWFKRKNRPLDWLIFGLGNPGVNYAATRHNVGWWVLDELARRQGVERSEHRHHGQVDYCRLEGRDTALIKPTTFMNRSGRCVAAWLKDYPEARWLVVFDDISLKPGKLRYREQGSAGGHKGIKSLIDTIGGKEFKRLKLGVGQPPPGMDSAEYVLEVPSRAEQDLISESISTSADAVMALLRDGPGGVLDVLAQYAQPDTEEKTSETEPAD